MKTVTLPSDERVPAFGQSTWGMGNHPDMRAEEIATLRLGLDLGLTLIDTAETYGDGQSEQLVAEAIGKRRDEVFLVSKVCPRDASADTIKACERSLKRLCTDHIDLYLLHWRGEAPLPETLAAFQTLQQQGKIRHYGVANFAHDDLRDLWSVCGGQLIATDQLRYNLVRRGIESDLLPCLRKQKIPVMAYAPTEQSSLVDDPQLIEFARRHGMTPPQTALAWLLAADDILVIPRSSHREQLKENFTAIEHPLTPDQLSELDQLFPSPDLRQHVRHPLEMAPSCRDVGLQAYLKRHKRTTLATHGMPEASRRGDSLPYMP